jgi:hypothetical protein
VGSVKYQTDGQIGDVLEGLVQKIEKINRQKNDELEKTRHILTSMDKLTESMSRLEYQRRREKLVANKIAHVYDQLERASGTDRGAADIKSLSVVVNKLLNGAKVTGQVIEIMASSLIVMMETVSGVLKNQQSGTRGYAPSGETKGIDLAALLKPVNILLNSLVSRQEPEPSPEPPAKNKEPEVKVQTPPEGENASVPVVKAVPAESDASPKSV